MDYVFCPICKRNVMLKQPTFVWILVAIPMIFALWCVINALGTNTLSGQVWACLAIFSVLVSIMLIMVCRMAVEPRCDCCGNKLSSMVVKTTSAVQPVQAGSMQDGIQEAHVQKIEVAAKEPDSKGDANEHVLNYGIWVDEVWYFRQEQGCIRVKVNEGKHRVRYKLTMINSKNQSYVIQSDVLEFVLATDTLVSVRYEETSNRWIPYVVERWQ